MADGTVHVLGLSFSVLATGFLIAEAGQTDSTATFAAIAIYCGMMTFAFLASALYHLLPSTSLRAVLNRVDHAAIYLKIAGTYTPLVVMIGSVFGYVILGIVWAIALLGAVAKLSVWATDARGSLALYLGMSWMGALLIPGMWQALPGLSCALIALGGGVYTLGTIVFAQPKMRYQNAIWHGFVLIASACFFGAIAVAATA